MRKREDRSIQRYRKAVPLRLKEFFIRRITQFYFKLGIRYFLHGRCHLILFQERDKIRRLILPEAGSELKGETGMELIGVSQLRLALIAYPVVLLALQAQEYVVLTGIEVMLSVLVYIRGISCFQRVNRKLIGILLLLMERIFHFSHSLHPMVFETVSHVSFIK